MIVDAMLDTNVIAYAASHDPDDRSKMETSSALIREARFGVSGQVLQEFYVTVTRKMRIGLSHDEALDWLEQLETFPCVPIDSSLVFHGAETARRYKISYWDGAIIAAAERLGAAVVFSEDLNHGQTYGSVRIVNPFRTN
jgi:predicted nucleic acid-binding protein